MLLLLYCQQLYYAETRSLPSSNIVYIDVYEKKKGQPASSSLLFLSLALALCSMYLHTMIQSFALQSERTNAWLAFFQSLVNVPV